MKKETIDFDENETFGAVMLFLSITSIIFLVYLLISVILMKWGVLWMNIEIIAFFILGVMVGGIIQLIIVDKNLKRCDKWLK